MTLGMSSADLHRPNLQSVMILFFSFPSSLVINSANPVGQQIVILHDAPTTLPISLMEEMATAGIAATFITSADNNNAYNTTPPYWEQECAELTSLQ